MQIVTLYEREEPKEQSLTSELRGLYGGDLSFPEPHSNRPYVIANFVETIDWSAPLIMDSFRRRF
jgi:hypothetical protein